MHQNIDLETTRVYRHSALVRVTHWINVLCLTLLLMSGLQIFNAHPALYWGEASDFRHPSFAITALRDEDGRTRGVTRLFGHQWDTTGVLGVRGWRGVGRSDTEPARPGVPAR